MLLIAPDVKRPGFRILGRDDINRHAFTREAVRRMAEADKRDCDRDWALHKREADRLAEMRKTDNQARLDAARKKYREAKRLREKEGIRHRCHGCNACKGECK